MSLNLFISYMGSALAAAVGVGGFLYVHAWEKKQKSKLDIINPEDDLTTEEAGTNYLTLARAEKNGKTITATLIEHSRLQHNELIGASGSGKNYYGLLAMIYQDVVRNAGAVIVDPKGAMRRDVEAFVQAAGRQHDFYCLDLANPASSSTYNPFLDDSPGQVTERIHAAFYGDDMTPTPHYRNLAKAFFFPFFGLCHRLGVLPTLDQLRQIAMDQQALASLLAKAPKSREAQELRLQFLSLDRPRYAEILQGVVNNLTGVTHTPWAPLLNTTTPGIDMREILKNNRILYVNLAADLYPTTYRLVSTLLLMDIQSSLTLRYNQNPRPLYLYMDEFANLVHPQIGDLIAKSREAKVGVTIAHQSLGDLERHGGPLAAAIFESTSNKVIYRVGSAETAERLARLIGTKPFNRDLINYQFEQGIWGGGKRAKGMTTVTGEEFIVHPNTLKNLAVGEAVMILQRPGGRRIYKAQMLKAPEKIRPLETSEFLPPKPGRQHKPLELAPPATAPKVETVPEPPQAQTKSAAPIPAAEPPSKTPAPKTKEPKSKTAAAEAALKLFDRSKKLGS